jgi:nucleotide-binding universal stress UspA family protein
MNILFATDFSPGAVAAQGPVGAGRFHLGTTAPIVLPEAPCPVLIARPGAAPVGGPRTYLLAVDASNEAEAATGFFARLALAPEFAVVLLSVADVRRVIPETLARAIEGAPGRNRTLATFRERARELAARALARAAEVLRRRGIPFVEAIREGHAAEAIVEEARARGAELLVLGARAAGTLGGVTRKVARYADCSVLAVRGKAPENGVRGG